MNNKIPERLIKRIPFKYAIIICQLGEILSEEMIMENAIRVTKKKYGVETLTSEDMEEIKKGLQRARYWVESFGPDTVKIKITKELLSDSAQGITDKQRKVLETFINDFPARDWDEDSLQNYIFNIGKEFDGNYKETFQLFYRLLIGKNFGPRLAPFLLSLDKEWIIERFKKAI